MIGDMVEAAKPLMPKVGGKVQSPKPILAAPKANISVAQMPSMHSGGPVMADGPYRLKAGEHVLTEAEAKKARKHALMASGMKSLAKPTEAKREKVDMAHAKSVLETESKFKATKPAPSYDAPPDRAPGTVDAKSVSKLNAVSENARAK